jgi:trimeric autotransporter adhesin
MKLVNTRFLVVLLVCHAAVAQIITTIAGTDFSFPSGSLAAVNAPLGAVTGVAVDAAGNVFVVDPDNNLVLGISANGTLNVVAGNGIPGFSGDGGPATSASLGGPSGIAVDSSGNLYIADTENNRIRKVSNGAITTVAGDGDSGFSGDGGPAASASLDFPSGVAVDSAGNIYIADVGNNRVRKVSFGTNTTGTITTVAGNGNAGFSGDGGPAASASLNLPNGVAVDLAGNLYIADTANGRIRKVSSGAISTVAGNGNSGFSGDVGPATTATFLLPYGVAVDSAGNLYIADTFSERIRKVSNGTITTVAGNGSEGFSGDGGPATSASLFLPQGVAVDSAGNLHIADTFNERIRKVSNGTITTFAGNGDYRFSGDEEPATSAALYLPFGATVDSAGNLYIADTYNQRIRKVSNGTISTVAGNGNAGFSGDGGPATSASLNSPNAVAVDLAGNLYIVDTLNERIRKVSNGTITTVAGGGDPVDGIGDGGPATGALLAPVSVAVDSPGNLYIADPLNNRVRKVSNGTITTVAGNGNAGFSGDGGPATSASLSTPSGVAVDLSGNLYIADTRNNRVRKVSGGTIVTVAGSGPSCTFPAVCGGFSGDGGPATSASLNLPFLTDLAGVAVDSAGNLYISDTNNNRIRKVSNGTITTVAGNGNPGFSGDGGPATSASLITPSGVAVDSAGNLYIADSYNNRIREVLSNPPSFSSPLPAGASSLSLTQASGGKAVTATLNADITTTENSSIAVPGMAYTAEVTSGGAWLSVSPQSGSTPGLITVTADPLNLSPATYNGVIVLSVPLANPPTQTVNVQFAVTPGVQASVSVDQSHMSFTYATTSSARNQTLIVSNSGGGSLNFTTSIALFSGQSANWLSVTPQSGTATPGNPVALAVRADPSILPPGTYTGSVTIQAGGQGGSAGSVTVPITMTITTNPLVLLLSQSGLTFTAVQNGGVVPPQTFGVLNLGSGTLNWSVQISTLTGGNWLNATPDSGSSAAAVSAPLVTASVNPAGLAPGVYYGLVKLVSAGAANTPQEVVAVLQVLPPGTDVAPIIQPTSLIFTAPAATSSPGSQNVLVYDPTGTSKSFSSTASGAASPVTLPTDATIAPTEPTQIVVQPFVTGLAPGTYQGTLTLQFSDGRVSAVGITFVVTGAGSSSSARAIPRDSASCTPTKLIPVLTTLGPGFTVPASYPQGLTAQVADDCGNPLTQGQVSVDFSTGQGLKYMQSLNNGRWDVTWQTGSQQTSSVILTVHATDPTQTITGDAQINGALGAPQPAPAVSDGGVVSAASFMATPLSPGGIISVFGSQLSDATSSAPVLPLSTQLNNTTVFLGNSQLPLFFTSAGQVNAAVPYETTVNTNLQLLVQRDNTYATPVYVDVAATQPGVLQYGQMQAIAVDVNGNLIGPSNPAHAGDLLTMYCLGLGAVNPAVADGAAAPSNPPASTVNAATVTVGTQAANVIFAGLTPTLAGLYQINFYVPQGTGTGDQVPVMLASGGQTSAAVNLSVQ